MPKTRCVLRKHDSVRDMQNPTQNTIKGEQKMIRKNILFTVNQAIDNILCFIRCKIISMLS